MFLGKIGNVWQKQKRMSVTKDLIDKFKSNIQRCRELRIFRKKYGYYHHMFVGEVSDNGCDLYHYHCAIIPFLKCKAPGKISKIRLNFEDNEFSSEILEIFNIDDENKDFEIVPRTDYPKDRKAEEDCIKRAELRLGEEKYSLTCNNCESYVNWIFANDNSSQQAESCTENILIGNAIDGGIFRGVEHIIKHAITGIIQAWEKLKKALEYIRDIIPSLYDLFNKLKEGLYIFIKFFKEIFNNFQITVRGTSVQKIFMKASELLKTVPTDLKQSVIQLIKAVIEAAKNVGPDNYEKIVNSAKQIVKKIADEIKKKSDKEAKEQYSPTALRFAVVFEMASLLKIMLTIYYDNKMTKKQKAQSVSRELLSSIFGVIGSTIGQILVPIPMVGSIVGGVLGNIAGGAFGGSLFSFIYSWFQEFTFELDVEYLQLSGIIFLFLMVNYDFAKTILQLL